MVCVRFKSSLSPLPPPFPSLSSVPLSATFQTEAGRERERTLIRECRVSGRGAWSREKATNSLSLKRPCKTHTVFVYFKAHLQALLAPQQGNVSKILGPSFVWSVMTSGFGTERNFWVEAGVRFLFRSQVWSSYLPPRTRLTCRMVCLQRVQWEPMASRMLARGFCTHPPSEAAGPSS